MKKDMKTERLTVRPIEEGDWRAIQAIWEDFNRSPYVIYDNSKNTASEELIPRIARWAEATRSGHDHMFFATCLGDEVIGFTSVNICPGGYEIGYGYLDRAQGHGYAGEALRAILDYMKTLGAERIYAGTAVMNKPSVRLLESLGFVMESTEPVSFHKDSEGRDIVFEGGNFVKCL